MLAHKTKSNQFQLLLLLLFVAVVVAAAAAVVIRYILTRLYSNQWLLTSNITTRKEW
jgi:cell division protein FtsL